MRAVRYSCCALEEDVFLHPRSALHGSAPEFVAYTELIRTAKRPYMAGGLPLALAAGLPRVIGIGDRDLSLRPGL